MSDPCAIAIERAVRDAAAACAILDVATAAKRIAAECGGPARTIADRLTEAGIKAGVTLQLGTPD
jgi:hypothetical protein